MNTNGITFNGPLEVNIEIMVINDDTDQCGKITIGLGPFKYPTPERIEQRLIEASEIDIPENVPGFRLMTKREAWDYVMLEKTGETFALPGGDDWEPLSGEGDDK